MGNARGEGDLVPPSEIAGTFQGNGCLCSPQCLRLEVRACACGICVCKYCGSCPIPCVCQFMVPCCNRCYCDCDDEGYWTPDRDTLDGKCGYGFVRVGTGGGRPVVDMER
jgi:hypothetical protein